MSLKFEIKDALPEHAIRHIVRDAEACMAADGSDAKAALVRAAREYLVGEHAAAIKGALDGAQEVADMTGAEPDIYAPLADVKAQIGTDFDRILASHTSGGMGALAYALAKAVVEAKPVLPMNYGKWLAKLGIVKAHIDALAPAQAVDDDADLAAALGGSDAPEALAPRPFAVASAAGADPHPPTSADVLNAEPHGRDVPPPPTATPRDAFLIFGEAVDVDDAALANRLGVSRSTIYNYLHGKTTKVRVTLAQARLMVAEIDTRTAKLRQAADIFAQIRE